MKKTILLLCFGCLLVSSTHAQGFLKRLGRSKTPKPTTFNRTLPTWPKRVSGVLKTRAEKATTQAYHMQRMVTTPNLRVPRDILYGPTQKVYFSDKKGRKTVQQLHSQLPYLQGSGNVATENAANYLVATQNRLYTLFAKSIIARQPRVPKIMHQVTEQTAHIGKPENAATWLAQQVPSDTQILIVGEGFYHNPSTVDAFASFLPKLREQMPDREMILLTNYLAKNINWHEQLGASSVNKSGYKPVWQNAYENGIEIIGIEDPRFEEYDVGFDGIDDTGVPAFRSWGTSFVSLDLAAKDMQQHVQAIQQLHPNALIILHVDQWQASYNVPFSLASRLVSSEKKLYATGITSKTALQHHNPFPEEEANRLSSRTTLFEQMYMEASLPEEGVVSREVAKEVGSDAWIKIPFDESKTDNGQY